MQISHGHLCMLCLDPQLARPWPPRHCRANNLAKVYEPIEQVIVTSFGRQVADLRCEMGTPHLLHVK